MVANGSVEGHTQKHANAHTDTLGTWVVVKIMVRFWVPSIIRHPLFRVPKKGP